MSILGLRTMPLKADNAAVDTAPARCAVSLYPGLCSPRDPQTHEFCPPTQVYMMCEEICIHPGSEQERESVHARDTCSQHRSSPLRTTMHQHRRVALRALYHNKLSCVL